MIHLTVRHTTTYTYANPVRLGEHRMMLRPRDSHDLRLVKADLSISPKATLRWMHDVFGNSIALARFDEPTTELSIESTLQIERYPGDPRRVEVTPEARVYPFIYSSEDRQDLARLVDLHYPDPKGALAAWAKAFVTAQPMDTLELVSSINSSIRQHFGYGVRNEEGTQTPQETLELGSGTCRDFRAADDRGPAQPGRRGPLRVRLSLRSRPRRRAARRPGRRRDACLGRGLSARRGVDRVRPDQRHHRVRCACCASP